MAQQEIVDGADGELVLEQRGMALVRDRHVLQARMAPTHLLDGGLRENVRVRTAQRQNRNARQGGKLWPERRNGAIAQGQALGQRRVVGWRRTIIPCVVKLSRDGGPRRIVLVGEGAHVEVLDELCRLHPRRGQRNATDIGDEANQSVTLDDWSDVVQNRATDSGRPHGRHGHGDEPAARGSDDGRV
jgi:hypothetical protein